MSLVMEMIIEEEEARLAYVKAGYEAELTVLRDRIEVLRDLLGTARVPCPACNPEAHHVIATSCFRCGVGADAVPGWLRVEIAP